MSRLAIDILRMPGVLSEIVHNAGVDNRLGIESTATWIREHPDPRQMVKAVGQAWSHTSLPVRHWVESITDVKIMTNERYTELLLEVTLEGLGVRSVLQEAPLGEEEVQRLAKRIPGNVPAVLKEIGAACPGLSIEDTGALMRSEFLFDPLGQISRWVACSDTTPSVCDHYGCEYPDPARFRLECADNGQACCYVLDVDNCIYYHSYGDLPGLVRCTVSPNEFVRAYFKSPEVILDPFTVGWAKYPRTRGRQA